MTNREILDAMGNLTTDAEAAAMMAIMAERGYSDVDDVPTDEWFREMIPEAVLRAPSYIY